ncbi:dihydrofolate reductase family protein [Aquimarina algiphila]|uniref:dihydrofolate reductase family protein n=1 Tax=Aquimarina algiphila TaxID=2047982 RepID=UPI00232FBBC1|nr:dihydrofolate reductase family protein [Aquimarina algiphila]
MRKIKLYIAMSINGKIAKADGNVDWLDSIPNPDQLDYGYYDFYETIDTTIQGNKTYEQIIDWGIDFPYSEKKNYVLTRKKGAESTKDVEFISENHIEYIKELKKQKGKDIWLVGGGQINTMLLNEKLIDEILVFIMPIVLSDGIELFESIPNETFLTLIETKKHTTGVVELRYTIT